MTTSPWWPSPYGAQDQIVMLNEITPAKMAAATRLVQSGRVYDLAHVLDEQVPAFPGRTFRQSLVTSAHHLNRRRPDAGASGWGENNVNWIIELVSSTSPSGRVVAASLPFLAFNAFVYLLGALEVIAAILLFGRIAVRYVGLLVLGLFAGTLLIFLIAPAVTGLPFLTLAGQFLLKDLVLFAATVMLIAQDSAR